MIRQNVKDFIKETKIRRAGSLSRMPTPSSTGLKATAILRSKISSLSSTTGEPSWQTPSHMTLTVMSSRYLRDSTSALQNYVTLILGSL